MGTSNVCLVNKTFTLCQGGVYPLAPHEAEKLLRELANGWPLNEIEHLCKEYSFNDFQEDINFSNKIAEISEKEGHHPDLKIVWEKCKVETWTHKINGLTESDFILTAKIEAISKN